MKTGILKGASATDAGSLIVILGGQTVLYRDAPLFDSSQIYEVAEEYKRGECDSLLFDKGAIFDELAYNLARDAVKLIAERYKKNKPKVVIYNAPEDEKL